MTEPKDPFIHEPYSKSDRSLKSLRRRSTIQFIIPIILALVVIYALVFVPLPYYIFAPGSAEQIRPMVEVKQGGFPEKGTFMLTTVSVSEANVLGYLSAKLNPDKELYERTQIRPKGESQAEYNERQNFIMQSSQSSAMEVAYQKAGIPYHIHTDKVIILQTLKGMPAITVFEPGDALEKIENEPIVSAESLQGILKKKKAGDQVKISFKRGIEEREASLTLALLPPDPTTDAKKAEPRAGLGIVPANVLSVRSDDEKKQVTVQAGEIGGPSAGLMFSLEIYNQLVKGDITKGYRIAGTGTIDEKGLVGAIGGIQHKIVAAERVGADYFFAPAANMKDAQAKADKIHAKMKLVSVATMEEAFNYLKALPQKAS